MFVNHMVDKFKHEDHSFTKMLQKKIERIKKRNEREKKILKHRKRERKKTSKIV